MRSCRCSVLLLCLVSFALAGCTELRQLIEPKEVAATPYDRGRQYFDEGRLAASIEQFRLVVAADPNSVAALNGLGAAYDRMGRFDLSASYYERALRLAPDSTQTLNNLGVSYLMQGKPDLAAVYLGEARLHDDADMAIAANHDAAIAAAALPQGSAAVEQRAVESEKTGTPIRRMTAAVQRLFTQARAVAVVPLPQPRPVTPHVIADEALTIDLSALPPQQAARSLPIVKGDESRKPYSSLTIDVWESMGAS